LEGTEVTATFEDIAGEIQLLIPNYMLLLVLKV
jgi:hypothetical protein